MSSRAEKLELLQKSLKKHFTLSETKTERNVLESLLYACCLEDTSQELADEAFAKLQQTYFDWNEVRVTTVIELSEVLSSLPNPSAAAVRIKKCLQALYESRYQYDIDDLKKANLSKATEDIQALDGVSPFVLNYVSQHALGGHSIPFGTASLSVLVELDVINASEAEKKTVPGAERAIPKTKGTEFADLLHTFAYEFVNNPKNPGVAEVFKDLGVTFKAPASPKKKEAPLANVGKNADKASKAVKTAGEEVAEDVKSKPKAAKVKGASEQDAALKPDGKSDKDDAKVAAKSSKPKSDKSKAQDTETADETESSEASKKPAKLANNVKMTKKKPK